MQRIEQALRGQVCWDLKAMEDSDVGKLQPAALVVIPSYEERSVQSLNRVLEQHIPSRCVMIVFPSYARSSPSLFPTTEDDETAWAYQENLASMRALLRSAGVPVTEVQGELGEPDKSLHRLDLEAGSLVDISCFPRNHLLRLLRYPEVRHCHLLYSRVREYEKNEAKFAVGVREICCVPGYEGEVRNRPTVLCISLGFEGNRAMAVFRTYDPYRTIAYLGRSTDTNVSSTAKHNNAHLLANSTVEDHGVATLDPYQFALDFLAGIQGFLKEEDRGVAAFDFVASVLGPKPQAIGIHYLCSAGLPLHVVYATPTKRRICSHGIGDTYLFASKAALLG
jgi:hypothetical protein